MYIGTFYTSPSSFPLLDDSDELVSNSGEARSFSLDPRGSAGFNIVLVGICTVVDSTSSQKVAEANQTNHGSESDNQENDNHNEVIHAYCVVFDRCQSQIQEA